MIIARNALKKGFEVLQYGRKQKSVAFMVYDLAFEDVTTSKVAGI